MFSSPANNMFYIYNFPKNICKALQPDLGLYFDFLEDSYKLRCISAGWHGGLRTLPCSHPKPTRYIHMHPVSVYIPDFH